MQGPLLESARARIRVVLDAMLALVAWALAPGGQMPLVTLRLQVWMRELRRMVGKVTPHPDQVALRADKDLKARPDGLYLPLIQCSECHTTGWLTHLRQRGGVMHPELSALAREGTIWTLVNTAGRGEWMPGMNDRTPRPTGARLHEI